jgi:hypothetical protein
MDGNGITKEDIRQRAYDLWEEWGRPEAASDKFRTGEGHGTGRHQGRNRADAGADPPAAKGYLVAGQGRRQHDIGGGPSGPGAGEGRRPLRRTGASER